MIIKEILAELETKDHPIAKALFKKEGFKILVLAFKRDMILKEHKAHLPTKLIVLEGQIVYHSDAEVITLNKYDEFDIPVYDLHAVTALENAVCMLIQG